MATGYCTTAQVGYYYNTNEVTSLADDDGDESADTGVVQAVIDSSSREVYSYIYDRYGSTPDPDSYTAGSGVYPILEDKTAILVADKLLARQGMAQDPTEEHPTIKWAIRVRYGIADIPGLG